MNEESRPVIALMKAQGATKGEMDWMNLYFDKYNLDKATPRIKDGSRNYAVVYHDIAEGGNYDFKLIYIGNDIEEACGAVFNHFDDNNQESKRCLMVGNDMENHQGIIYYVVNLEEPPIVASDYQWLSRYYVLCKN